MQTQAARETFEPQTYDPHRVTPTLYIRESNSDDRALALELYQARIKYNLIMLSDEAVIDAEKFGEWQFPEIHAGEGSFQNKANIEWWKRAYGKEYVQVNEREHVQAENILKFQRP